MTLKEFTNREIMQELAERERAEIIKNAEEACRKGEITKDELMQIRLITAKYLVTMDDKHE